MRDLGDDGRTGARLGRRAASARQHVFQALDVILDGFEFYAKGIEGGMAQGATAVQRQNLVGQRVTLAPARQAQRHEPRLRLTDDANAPGFPSGPNDAIFHGIDEIHK